MRSMLLSAVGAIALCVGGVALAHPGGGPPAGAGGGMGPGVGVGPVADPFGMGGRPGDMSGRDFGVSIRDQARVNSQGPSHAAAQALAHANSNSVLAAGGTVLVTGPLAGLTVGMPVFNGGTQVGTVQRIIVANGTLRNVLVLGSNGRVYALSPNTLTLSGGTVTTSALRRG